MRSSIFAIYLSLLSGFAVAQQTVFDDPALMGLIKKGAIKIYSVDVDSSRYYIEQVREKVPDHPVVTAMEAFLIQWQYIPVLEGDVFLSFESKLLETITRAEKIGVDNPEAIFFIMAARGLLAEYYADDGQYMRAFREANQMYGMLKEGFDYVEAYPEFLFTAGLYNYFRIAYPDRHPIYAPLLWFFRDGDKEKGLAQIHAATKETVLSKVEAYIYLAYIYLRYEEKPEKALGLLTDLRKQFPTNPYVAAKYLEAVYGTHKYQLITTDIIAQLHHSQQPYYQMTALVFEGARLEFVEGKPAEAFESYRHGTAQGEQIVGHGEYYKSIGYVGMGRLKKNSGDVDEAKSYYKQALEYAETEEIREEAKEGLK